MKFHAKALSRKGKCGRVSLLLRAFACDIRFCRLNKRCIVGCVPLAADVRVDALLSDLHQPCGVVVRPGGTADRYEVFVADSGAGRVVRWSSTAPKQAIDVVTGFTSQGAADPFHQGGPLTLAFLDPGLIVVGATGDSDGRILRAYELPEGDKSLSAADTNEATLAGKSECCGLHRHHAVASERVCARHAAAGDSRIRTTGTG